MAHITGHDRSQTLLFPEAVDDYVSSDNPVRFIDAFVDGLDLVAAGFARVAPKVTGRPGYAPTDLLKLYIYGYLNRVRSSRRLEAETHRNIVIWLLRHLRPDFKTIADKPAITTRSGMRGRPAKLRVAGFTRVATHAVQQISAPGAAT
jgi:transposase